MACADALNRRLLRMFMRHGFNDGVGRGQNILVTSSISSTRKAAIATGNISDGHTGFGQIDANLTRCKAA